MDKPFSIGSWKVEPILNRLMGPSGTHTVEPRTMRVLVHLAAASGDVVTRDQLLTAVWSGSVVTEHSLTIAISDLRKLLGDDPADPSYIETVRGVGYRIIKPVQFQQANEKPAIPRKKPARSISTPLWTGIASLVVLVVAIVAFFGSYATRDPIWQPALHAIKPLTSLSGIESWPAFSPNGQRVAFVAFTATGAPADLYVQQLDAEAPVRLTDLAGAEMFPAWSPDGQWIAFLSYAREGCGLFRIPSIGGVPHKIHDTTCRFVGLQWAPNGEELFYAAQAEGGQPLRIYRLALENGTPEPVTAPPGTILGDVVPVFSPDGSALAFVRKIDGATGDLHILDLARPDAPPRRLTNDGVSIAGFDWMADGKSLIFASNRAETQGLWKVAAAGGEPPSLIQAINVDDPGSVAIARQGEFMVYVDWTFEVNTWRLMLDSDSSVAEPLLRSTRVDYNPAISIDGRIAFVSSRTGATEIWISRSDGSSPYRLTSLNRHATQHPRWSPEGRRVAFESTTDSHADVYIVDASGGAPNQLTFEGSQEVRPSWSHDGAYLYFGSDRTGKWQIWRQPVAGGNPEQVTLEGGREATASPNGRFLYYTRPDSSGIWRKAFDTGEETCFLPDNPLYWEVVGQSMYITNSSQFKGTLEIKRHNLESGRVADIATLPMSPVHVASSWGFAVAPDESWLLFSQVDRSESDLMLTEGAL